MLTSPSTADRGATSTGSVAVALAAAALLAGCLFYVFARPPGSTLVGLPVGTSLPWTPAGTIVPALGALPSLVHVFAFGLFSAAAVGLDRRAALVAPAAWLVIDATFEWMQMPDVRLQARALLDASPAPQPGAWLLPGNGTFDPLDLAALALGAALATLVIARLRRSSSRESHHAES